MAVINNTNFPDANFRTVVKTFDTNNDNRLDADEIAEARNIDCHGKNIASLKGIAYFTETTTLNCYSNKLTTLDISKNTKLSNLDCSSNKLKTLDISKNTNLSHLNIRSNLITQLDVSGISCLRSAVLKGRNTANSQYDYFKDPRYMTFTTYIHGMPGGSTSIDVSYYLYVDKTVTVKAAGVTFKASVEPPAATSSGSSKTSSGSSKTSSGSSNNSSTGNNSAGSVTASGGDYKVSNGAAVLTGTSDSGQTTLTIPDTIKDGSKTYKVTTITADACKDLKKLKTIVVGKNVKKIAKGAFSGCKAKKLVLKTKLLKKKAVKGCLKGSKIKTVQVKIGKKKVNKKYVKKYKKIFKKKIVGKKVKVK